jgi:predicted Zn-dependent peptidase
VRGAGPRAAARAATATAIEGALHPGQLITTLDSGVRVVSERVPGVRSVALGIWIGTGSALEHDSEAGISHLLEHMLFRGSDRYASEEIDQIFDAMGAEINAGTDKEATSLYTRALDRHLPRAFDVMSDMVFRPRLGELDAERQVVLEEIAMYEDDPQERVFDVLGEAIFGSHPLGRAVIGRAEIIGAATRDQLVAFHREHYRAERIVVAAAGSVDHDALVGMAGSLGTPRAVTSRAAAERGAQAAAAAAEVNGGAGRVTAGAGGGVHNGGAPGFSPHVGFLVKDTEQYHVCLGRPGLARDDERRFALRVLEGIFGGTSSSRLFQQVRERRGLAYSVFSFSNLYTRTGEAGLYVGTRPENLSQALSVIAEELARCVADPADEEELIRSRENLKGRVVLSMESTAARMSHLGASALSELPILSLDEVIERIDAVGIAELRELAAELFSLPLSVAGVGPDEELFRAAIEPFAAAATEANGRVAAGERRAAAGRSER